jgi:hypothetical protein
MLAGVSDFDYDASHTSVRLGELSQRETWENNGVLDSLHQWSRTAKLLWVGGRSGDRQPWVTALSFDLTYAMRLRDCITAQVYCAQAEPPMTPISLAKHLIVQILLQNPELAIQIPDQINARVLKNSTRTFVGTWRTLITILTRLPYVFLVLDRLDRCEDGERASVKDDLIPALISLSKTHASVDVVTTSIFMPPVDIESRESLMTVWIDTGVRPKRRD